MSNDFSERRLLGEILKQVSRSFYLTMAVLPASVSRQVSLAYLFARAADSIADASGVDRNTRTLCLQKLKSQFLIDCLNWETIRYVQAVMTPLQSSIGERALVEQLENCFRLYQSLAYEDQCKISQVLPILISGMEMDLAMFPGESETEIEALPTMADLDAYTYRVAGCVGVFWTNVMYAHLPRIQRQWDLEAKGEIGIRFGKGLQLTNILKDLPKDLRRGRCYIPQAVLEEVNLQPKDLLDKHNISRFRPVLRKLVGIALSHLDQGWVYALSIPKLEVRLRLACMWPTLIALRSLHLLINSRNVLDPSETLKISRVEVYHIMLITTLTGGCGYPGTAYWGHIRKAIG